MPRNYAVPGLFFENCSRDEVTFAYTEDLINSQPLTYENSDIKDEVTLMLNHFLISRYGGDFFVTGLR